VGRSLRRSVGYVLQDVGLFPHMSVEDNVAVVPPGTVERRSHCARVNELLELVGLLATEFAHRWPTSSEASVNAWRGRALPFTVLLMDEPFGALDHAIELHREFRRSSRACANP
jgi:osmoprotectant transport system ATP-binding protein